MYIPSGRFWADTGSDIDIKSASAILFMVNFMFVCKSTRSKQQVTQIQPRSSSSPSGVAKVAVSVIWSGHFRLFSPAELVFARYAGGKYLGVNAHL